MKLQYTEKQNYENCDILFRVYFNQLGVKYINKNKKETFCFEILSKRHVKNNVIQGRFTSEHPQGVREAFEQLINSFRNTEYIILFSNEVINIDDSKLWINLGGAFDAHGWFRNLFDIYRQLTASKILL